MKRMLLVIPFLLVGCGIRGGAPCPAGGVAGMIRIESARIAGVSAALPTVDIRNVSRNGQPLTPWEASGHRGSVGGTISGIRVEADRLVCDMVCSFGQPGRYRFDVSAPGAADQPVEVNIPGRDAGGCGGILIGTPVTLHLTFQPVQGSGAARDSE